MIELLAQIEGSQWLGPITQFGVAGSMLYWLTARVETRMKAMENAVDRMAKAAILQILGYKMTTDAGVALQKEAQELLDEINNKQRSGNRS